MSNHYHTLQISSHASAAEIKKAYRHLVKKFHPDSQSTTADHEQIVKINAAYEVLGDDQRRQRYDRELATPAFDPEFEPEFTPQHSRSRSDRQARTAQAQQHQRYRATGKDLDFQLHQWQQQVYAPVHRFLVQILYSLQSEIDALAADPFDQALMDDFMDYLEDCRRRHQQAQQIFQQIPNPIKAAGIAAALYHCLCRLSEGIEELHWFTTSYDDHHLHTGQELFRIANDLRLDAQRSLRVVSGKF
ncbi:MAG: DnaJ domain-containing protein [Coleofasciculaceae cyanobacterium SM2_1_6]|nr:DnaJ domain-containing protein [Coleofasciculaceae cyanobacterium SM2_1_6]